MHCRLEKSVSSVLDSWRPAFPGAYYAASFIEEVMIKRIYHSNSIIPIDLNWPTDSEENARLIQLHCSRHTYKSCMEVE